MNIENSDNRGLRIKEERSRLGLSQKALGEIIGKQPNAILNYEKGVREIDIIDLIALYHAGFDIWFLITGQRTGIVPLPANEQEILRLFHQVEPNQRETLLTLVRNFAQSFSVK